MNKMCFPDEIEIDGTKIGEDHSPYVIAEISSNHNKDLDTAKTLIKKSAEAGADAVKFQTLRFEKQYFPPKTEQDIKKRHQKIDLPENWYKKLKQVSDEQEITFLSSPAFVEGVDWLEDVDVPAYKIASAQSATDPMLVEKVASLNKPLIISTGISTYEEIEDVLRICLEKGNQNLIFLHCVSKYPTEPSQANLNFIRTLRKMTGCLTGLSDHSLGTHLAVASVPLGTALIEKHVTLDREDDGPDHHFSLEPEELADLVKRTKEAWNALGDGRKIHLDEQEREFKAQVTPKCISRDPISAGEGIKREKLSFKRAKGGIPVKKLDVLVKHRATERIESGQLIEWDLLEYHTDD